ncbi:ABC transporter permease subunit [Herbiconiux moechotypicola]|uniref:ABC transporter permease n=1 Tax=Herbiconiux moechotypicola TaxID=637393 RepID=A0ABN3DEA0_9MICO|nr:ABC transporter permease subunit [Herbiconiux moechotypicola]MCS5729279.1 ABC transporter permease subunit [Herbiconiux moechotypicola]
MMAAGTRDRFVVGALVVGLIVAWEVASRAGVIDPYVMAEPSQIVAGLWEDRDLYLSNSLATLRVAAIGYVVGQAIALALAFVLSMSSALELVVTKLALVVYCLPTLAIAPILGTIVGLDGTRVAVVAIVVFFPTLLSTTSGLRAVTADQRSLVRSLGGGRVMVLRKIAFRSALPQIFAGLKLGVPGAVLGAIASEWLGASSGLGIFMVNSLAYLQPLRVWGTCVVLVAGTLVLYWLVGLADRKVNGWSEPMAGSTA